MSENAWFTVLSKDSIDVVRKYLYNHTSVVYHTSVEQYGKTLTVALLETVADTEAEALRLAQYQADRLASGLHGVSSATQTAREALQSLEERTGVTF